ncbi:MAG: 5'-methylthioadenosine nucleosidase [Planctomycetes bacterium]|nr:5'-methylthioadenosine nucleosidase [Planctomycetota bacterium]
MLRWLLSSWLQGLARDRLRTAATEAARQQFAGQATAQTGSAEEVARADVAVVFALGIELGGFEDLLSGLVRTRGAGFTVRHGLLRERPILVLETGAGSAAARQAAEAIIAAHRPRWVISAGFSGGLQPRLKRGDIVMANSLVSSDHQSLTVDFSISEQALAATSGLHVGRLLMTEQVILRAEEKERLGREYDALAVDLESFAVAEVCRREKVRFLAVRVISDAMTEELPREVERLIAPQSLSRRMGTAVGAVWNRPGSVKDMLKLREDALTASDRLAKFLVGVVRQLE